MTPHTCSVLLAMVTARGLLSLERLLDGIGQRVLAGGFAHQLHKSEYARLDALQCELGAFAGEVDLVETTSSGGRPCWRLERVALHTPGHTPRIELTITLPASRWLAMDNSAGPNLDQQTVATTEVTSPNWGK